jgi:hypothetical protein
VGLSKQVVHIEHFSLLVICTTSLIQLLLQSSFKLLSLEL